MKLALFGLIGLLVFPTMISAWEEPAEIVTTADQLLSIITYVTNMIFTIVLALAIIFIIIAAFNFLTAGGSPEKIATARQMLIYALIGIAVALLAKSMRPLIEALLSSGAGTGTPTTPLSPVH